MIKISDVVREIVQENPHLEFGVTNQLFNLSQLAKFMQPLIEVRLQKEVKPSAILMNLSRMQRQQQVKRRKYENFAIENITIQSNLITFTVYKNEKNQNEIQEVYGAIHRRNGYFGLMEGMNELTIVFEKRLEDVVLARLTAKPKYRNDSIAALIIKFPKAYAEAPGFLHAILRALAFQNVNIVEAASTFSEFTVYVDRKDIQLAFETLEKTF